MKVRYLYERLAEILIAAGDDADVLLYTVSGVDAGVQVPIDDLFIESTLIVICRHPGCDHKHVTNNVIIKA